MATDKREALYAALVKVTQTKGNPFTGSVREILAAYDLPEAERPSAGTIGNLMDSLADLGCIVVTDNGSRAPKTYAVVKPFDASLNGSSKPAVVTVPQPAAPLAAVVPALVPQELGADPLAERFGPVRAAVEIGRQRQRELRMEIERLTELYEAGEREMAQIGALLQAPLQADKPAAAAADKPGEAIAS